MFGPCWKKATFWSAAVAVGCLGMAGCSSGDSQTKATTAASKAHKGKKSDGASKPGEENPGDMVAAVSASKGPPVELKFMLPVRPEVGQITDIDQGSQMDRVEKLTAGSPIRHVAKELPKRDGIFSLTAVVSYTSSNQDVNRTYSIPVIAGQGMPDQVAKGPCSREGSQGIRRSLRARRAQRLRSFAPIPRSLQKTAPSCINN